MLVELGSLSGEQFDAKAWVNALCSSRPPDDEQPPEKYLQDVEMKLQLLAEDITASLEEQSSAALLRVPRAVRETNRVRDDAVSLRGTVGAILQRLEQVETSSAQSVAALAKVDAVKQKLEGARDTLEYAAGLAQLSATVEDVFASGDLPRVADTLSSMRRCLAVVGEVPDFADMKAKLAALEDRLEKMVQPRLTDALNQRKAETAQSLRDILLAIERRPSLEQTFCRVRSRPLKRMWEEFDGPSAAAGELPPGAATLVPTPGMAFSEWLPRFYDEMLIATEQEIWWSATAFPGDHCHLVPELLQTTLSSITPSFRVRLDNAMVASGAGSAAGVPGGQAAGKLGVLQALHGLTGSFARNCQRVLASAGVSTAPQVGVVRAAYAPYEPLKAAYGDLEREHLLAVVHAMDLRSANVRGFGQRGVELSMAVRRMEASVPAVIVALEGAVDRCLALTGGSEAEALVRVVDDALTQYTARLLDCLRSLRPVCGLPHEPAAAASAAAAAAATAANGAGAATADGSKDKDGVGADGTAGQAAGLAVEEEEEWSIIQGSLQLLTVSESLGMRSAVFEASLRATLGRLTSRLHLLQLPQQPGTAADGGSSSGDGASAAASGSDGGGGAAAAAASAGGRDGGAPGVSSAVVAAQGAEIDIAVLRLADAPEKAMRLSSLVERARDPRFHALPRGSQRVHAFREATSNLVFDVLIAKVRRQLRNVASMPEWSAAEEENAFDLPSFSAYPLPYITTVGEYLLTLPQQLEPLAVAAAADAVTRSNAASAVAAAASSPNDAAAAAAAAAAEEDSAAASGGAAGAGDDAGGYFVREWMLRVAEGAATLFVEQVKAIPKLSERGAQQLSADIEYLCSVLGVLYVASTATLATFQACLATPREQLKDLISQEAGPGGSLEGPTARLVAKMRGVALD